MLFRSKINLFRLRRPKPKVRLVWMNQLCADRITAFSILSTNRHSSRSSATLVMLQSDFSFHPRSTINNAALVRALPYVGVETLHEI